jgi:hypothetical protein
MDPQPQTGLGADDYQSLLGMFVSPDAGARAQAATLAKKMTPDEQQGFFDFQQQANRGRDAASQRVDSNIIGGTEGGGIAPEDVLMVGQAGRAITRAAMNSGMVGAVQAAAAQASPVIKYEVARHTLTAIGIPNAIATPVAMVISGYTRGGKGAVPGEMPGPVDPAAPHLDRSVPVQPGALTQEQIGQRVFSGQGTPAPAAAKPPLGRVRGVIDVLPPDVAPVRPGASTPDAPAPLGATGDPAAAPPSPPGSAGPAPPVTNTLPDQRALNEAALAARRAAYQARVQAAAEADAGAAAQTPAPARLKLTAPESKEYLRLRQLGQTDPQAMEALQAARDFQQRFGTPTPTVAETKFPKGGGR